MPKKNLQSKKGLVLIEIVTVIGVLVIIIGILYPVISVLKERTKRTICASNLHQIGIALHMYAQDYDGYFPPPEPEDIEEDPKEDIGPRLWQVYPQYLENPRIYSCLSDRWPAKFKTQKYPRDISYFFPSDIWVATMTTDDSDRAITWEKRRVYTAPKTPAYKYFPHKDGLFILFVGGQVKWYWKNVNRDLLAAFGE